MKIDYGFSKILIVLLTLTFSTLPSCTPTTESEPADIQAAPMTDNEAETTGGPPPLVVDTSAPLLLDEPTGEEEAFAVATTQAAVENAACFVCHANYKTESLVDCHVKVNIGCVNCHGQSSAHQNDENNITPPETMYSADKIDPFCRSCHNAHDIPPKKIIAHWLKHIADKTDSSCGGCHEDNDVPPAKVVALWTQRGLDKNDPNEIVCTDCHGDHRMKVRTVIWDKKSGKLLRTNRGD
jgi:hypothetical protein